MQMANGVSHIHSNRYAHLDIKLNNVFLDSLFNVKIGDFGSAIKLTKNGKTNRRRGTTSYMAPEVKSHTKTSKKFDAYKADIYSLGVCLFILLFKTYPKRPDPTEPRLEYSSPTTVPNPFSISNERWN